jgi:hypothetical protein
LCRSKNRRFRAFPRSKYSPERLKDRLGFADIRNVRVPSWSGIANSAGYSKITNPLVQEWIDFRESHRARDGGS